MPKYKFIETQTVTGLKYWATGFINGDWSGSSEEDCAEADAWLAFHQPTEPNRHAEVSDVDSDDSDRIGRFYDCRADQPSYGKLCDLATYTLTVYELEA